MRGGLNSGFGEKGQPYRTFGCLSDICTNFIGLWCSVRQVLCQSDIFCDGQTKISHYGAGCLADNLKFLPALDSIKVDLREQPLMIWGGGGQKKKNWRPLARKIIEGHSPVKKNIQATSQLDFFPEKGLWNFFSWRISIEIFFPG